MDNESLWELTRNVSKLLMSCYEPAVEPIIQTSGLDARYWGLLLAVRTFEPENTSPAHLMVRGPYTSADQYLARLQTAASHKYLDEISPGEFKLSEKGQKSVDRFIQEARRELENADPLNKPAADELASMFNRLVHACLVTPPPPDTWSIRLSYKLMPDLEPPLPFIEQAISCLYAYRDDAHLAAWQNSNLSATALEALTHLWKNEAVSLEDLMSILANRGHTEEIYLDALAELREREFIAGSRSKFRVTPAGKNFRDQVEMDTDLFFFTPWSYLSKKEKNRMEELLVRLWDGMKERVAII